MEAIAWQKPVLPVNKINTITSVRFEISPVRLKTNSPLDSP
jgi:hypothetical protein